MILTNIIAHYRPCKKNILGAIHDYATVPSVDLFYGYLFYVYMFDKWFYYTNMEVLCSVVLCGRDMQSAGVLNNLCLCEFEC